MLDLAAGTGTSSQPFADAAPRSCRATSRSGCSRSASASGRGLPFAAGDATLLPFADETFDAVTISFGLRNIVDPIAGLRELLRVTKPGGRARGLRVQHADVGPVRAVYGEYLMRALPTVARKVSSNPDSYVYLAESIREWPDQQGARRCVSVEAGWGKVEWRNLSGGIVALHHSFRP